MKHGFWMSSPSVAAAEMAKMAGYDFVVLDIEHGAFDLQDLERFIPFLRAIGLEVLSKVLAAERAPIQQVLDFGSDAVVIPHVQGVDHAARVCGYAKFPPLGDRSYAGGRVASYGGFDDAWLAAQDAGTRCFPMIEGAAALAEIDAILALPVVDGVFIGPSDLSLRRARGAYTRSPADFADIIAVAEAAGAAGKPWILPAWSPEEKALARCHGAGYAALTMEHGVILQGLRAARQAMEAAE